VTLGSGYVYRVAAENAAGPSAFAGPVTVTTAPPAAPTGVVGTPARQGSGERVTVTWNAVAGATGYQVQWSTDPAFTTVAGTGSTTGAKTFTTSTIARTTWNVRVRAVNGLGSSAWTPAPPVPAAP